MSGELSDDGGVRAGIGEVGAERVAQYVRGATFVRQVGGLGVPGDDAGDVAGAELSTRGQRAASRAAGV